MRVNLTDIAGKRMQHPGYKITKFVTVSAHKIPKAAVVRRAPFGDISGEFSSFDENKSNL